MMDAIQILFILVAAAATATPPSGRKVVVRVDLTGCAGTPASVDVVLDGDEGTRRPLTLSKDPKESGWVAEWIDERKRKFPGARLSASVRFNDGRTYCQFAQPEKNDNDALVARFLFYCDDAPVLNVTIGTIPPRIFSYERRLPGKARPVVPPRCACVEKGNAVSGTAVVRQVMFPQENFSLQFLNDAENARSSDLLVLDPAGENAAAEGREIFDDLIRKNAVVVAGGDPRCKVGEVCLRRGGIIVALGQQRARARPKLLPQAYSVDEENLQNLSLLTLAVK